MEIGGIFGSKIWKEQLQKMVIILAGVTAMYALVQAWNNGYSPSIWFSLHAAEIGHESIAPQLSYNTHIYISPSIAPQGLVLEFSSNDSKVTHALPPQGLMHENGSKDSVVAHALPSQEMVKKYNSSAKDEGLLHENGSNDSVAAHALPSQEIVKKYNSSAKDEGLNVVNSNTGVHNGASSAKGFFNENTDNILSNNFSVAHQNNMSTSADNSFHNATEETNSVSGSIAINGSPQMGYNDFRHDQEEWVKALEQQLAFAKFEIENAPAVPVTDPDLYGPLYHNLSRFKRSYEMMEKIFKVYVYAYGEKPYFHKGPMEAIYASEGWFMKQVEENKQFVTKDFREAHMYYIPYSVYEMRVGIPAPQHQNMPQITNYIRDQINTLSSTYPFWNRTHGRDHFFVACHDWGPYTTAGHKELKLNAVKVLCNADLSDGFFHLRKDGGLPETYLHGREQPPGGLGGLSPRNRSILAFFAGGNHGRVRPVLFKYWKDKDPDIRVYQNLPPEIAQKRSYIQHMKETKFCICPMGYEVNSPRMVEAIYYDCVPVIIADNFFLPFSEVIKWQSFSIIVAEKDIPNLKDILLKISEKRYLTMYFRLGKVRKHFLWHKDSPKRYDIFHMILHSVWTSRLNQTPILEEEENHEA